MLTYRGAKIMTPESLADDGRKIPAALILPAGKFFFGFTYVPFDPSKVVKKIDPNEVKPDTTFSGTGNTLLRRRGAPAAQPTPAPAAPVAKEDKPDPWASLSGGNTLSGKKAKIEKVKVEEPEAKKEMTRQEVVDMTMLDEDDFMFGETYDDDDGVIEIDSD
jgi:ubiquitin fusion degradation protein 1